jgi:plastocyanin
MTRARCVTKKFRAARKIVPISVVSSRMDQRRFQGSREGEAPPTVSDRATPRPTRGTTIVRLGAVLAAIGMIVAALIVRGPREAPAAVADGVISMGHEEFGRTTTTIRAGEHLTFANTSHWLHVIIPGESAAQRSQDGVPRLGARDEHLSERGDRWTTGAWNRPGTYFLTCQLHPEMTLEVHVLPRHAARQQDRASSAVDPDA